MKLIKDILDGLYCKFCKSDEFSCLYLNTKDNQLKFKCNKCKRRWI